MLDQITKWLTSIPTDEALWVLVLMFITLDVMLGTTRAVINHELSSAIARQGIMHKMGFIGAMLLCNIIDIAQGIGHVNEMLGYAVPVTALCTTMIISCESISIAESIQAMNPNIDLKFLDKNNKKKDSSNDDDKSNVQ